MALTVDRPPRAVKALPWPVMTVRVPCAGALIRDEAGRLLLVRRGTEPGRGRWSVPGGRCEPGETATQAAVREAREETGLEVSPGPVVGRVERPGPGGVTYVIDDVACRPVGGTLAAGDDADEVRWVDAAGFAALPLVDGLAEALTEWAALPRRVPQEPAEHGV
jgi:8-oxo-dGTP diphosphatase